MGSPDKGVGNSCTSQSTNTDLLVMVKERNIRFKLKLFGGIVYVKSHNCQISPSVNIYSPRHQLDEVVVECDACTSVEDGGVGVAVEVCGHNLRRQDRERDSLL